MNDILQEDNFKHIGKLLTASASKEIVIAFRLCLMQSNPNDIIKKEYDVCGKKWIVYHGPTFKMTLDEDHTYHCFFNKLTGLNIRFGKTLDDDPIWCPLGPEILDLEVSVNGCVPISGTENCKYCYKNNTNAAPTNMSFDTFKRIVDSFPMNLSQIAFGITGLQTNADLPKMFEYCRTIGIIPNLTTVGADMNEATKDMICKYAGACAVSCYTNAEEFCYKTIKELYDYAFEKYNRVMHINMHIVLSKDNYSHVMKVLNDIKDNKVVGLKSVVFLRMKPKGRAANTDCTIDKDTYKTVIEFCLANGISLGFDSCSATTVIDALKDLGKDNMRSCCEPCESNKFSAYINVKGIHYGCSFAEGTEFAHGIDVLRYNSSIEWWPNNYNSYSCSADSVWNNPVSKSCPIYKLD